MRSRLSGRLVRVIGIIAVFAAGFGAGGVYMAYGATTGDTYYGCLTSQGNLYRVRVNASYSCIGSDKKISWNQKGQPGTNGLPGPQGPEGPQGIQGPAGQDAPFVPVLCPDCDLSSLDEDVLTGRNLTLAHLRGANLDSADLSDVNLTDADLRGANLANATLSGSNLTSATFHGATFDFTYFNSATIEDTWFVAASFADSDLENAVGIPSNTSGATWSNTICPDGTNSDDNLNTCDGHFLSLP